MRYGRDSQPLHPVGVTDSTNVHAQLKMGGREVWVGRHKKKRKLNLKSQVFSVEFTSLKLRSLKSQNSHHGATVAQEVDWSQVRTLYPKLLAWQHFAWKLAGICVCEWEEKALQIKVIIQVQNNHRLWLDVLHSSYWFRHICYGVIEQVCLVALRFSAAGKFCTCASHGLSLLMQKLWTEAKSLQWNNTLVIFWN